MKAQTNGGVAFPVATGSAVHQYGMTLRDYFAAKAMEGAAANPHILDQFHASGHQGRLAEWLARVSYVMADSMLAEREK